MKNKLNGLLKWGVITAVAVAPYMVFAQTQGIQDNCGTGIGGTTLGTILCKIAVLINTIIPILITLGVVYFIWGVISYVIAKEDEAKTKGRDMMIYGLIGLLVIVSIWGLVNVLKRTFGINDSSYISVPCISTPGAPCNP